jgi:DNA-binding NarL/FixJ family response regulator
VYPRRPPLPPRLLGAAHGLSEALGEVFSPISGDTFGLLTERVQGQLSEQAFAAAWAEGLGLSREEAVHAALEAAEQGALDQQTAPAQRNVSDAPDALTRREQEVALLLAQGYTDRQIADQLSIAVSTVGVHVHHILAKLDLRSRHQVAGWASEQRLLDATTSPADHVDRR